MAKDLMQYLPSFYREIREMREIQNTASEEIDRIADARTDAMDQLFLDTATWGLAFWEKDHGLETDPSKPDSWRREILKAKIQGTGTATKKMIIETATSFSGGEVDVVEYPEENRFEVWFVGTRGIPPNIDGFIQMVETIKPAHLAYDFKYTYTVFKELNNKFTHLQMANLTYGDLNTQLPN